MVICAATGSRARTLATVAKEDSCYSGFKKPAGGFTLIELMLCVSIIGVLAAIATPLYL